MTIAITILISLLVGYFAGRVHQVFAFHDELIEEKKREERFRQFIVNYPKTCREQDKFSRS